MTARRKLPRVLVALPIRVYRLAVSPLLPPACRFAPTCSAYAEQAIVQHGVVRGSALAIRRVLRCHPWSEPGVDEVPATPR